MKSTPLIRQRYEQIKKLEEDLNLMMDQKQKKAHNILQSRYFSSQEYDACLDDKEEIKDTLAWVSRLLVSMESTFELD